MGIITTNFYIFAILKQMNRYELKLPEMGESVSEAKVVQWLKSVGDTIDIDDAIVEVATDKVDSEVPSEIEGILVEIRTSQDTVVKVGEVMAIIETEASIDTPTQGPPEEIVDELEASIEGIVEEFASPQMTVETAEKETNNALKGFLSPLVKSIITAEKITPKEIEGIPKTGAGGRHTKMDLQRYLQKRPLKKSLRPMSRKTLLVHPFLIQKMMNSSRSVVWGK